MVRNEACTQVFAKGNHLSLHFHMENASWKCKREHKMSSRSLYYKSRGWECPSSPYGVRSCAWHGVRGRSELSKRLATVQTGNDIRLSEVDEHFRPNVQQVVDVQTWSSLRHISVNITGNTAPKATTIGFEKNMDGCWLTKDFLWSQAHMFMFYCFSLCLEALWLCLRHNRLVYRLGEVRVSVHEEEVKSTLGWWNSLLSTSVSRAHASRAQYKDSEVAMFTSNLICHYRGWLSVCVVVGVIGLFGDHFASS